MLLTRIAMSERSGLAVAMEWVIGLEDIRKPLSGFLEPGVAGPGHGRGHQGVDAQSSPVGQTAPDQHLSRLLDDEGERVGHDPGAHFFRQRSYGIKDGRKKHHHRGDDADGLPDVAQEHAQGGQHPGQSQRENNQWQQHQRGKNRCPVQVAVEQGKGDQQHAQADEAVEQGCAHADDGQYFQREDDFLDVVDVAKDQAGGAVDDFGKQAVHDHANKQHHGELGFAFFAPYTPAGLEHHGKNKSVHGQHEHGVEERPGHAHDRAFVAAGDFALGHLHDELSVAPKTED